MNSQMYEYIVLQTRYCTLAICFVGVTLTAHFTPLLGPPTPPFRMCLPIPIDAVYTWVNGSDPKLIADLQRVKDKLEKEAKK